jgi:rare lipoprotein A
VRVTNIENGRSIVLRVNDRGPFARGRIIDVSRRAAQLLGFEGQGTARVRVEMMADESRQLKAALTGRDENRTFAAVPRADVASDALPPPPGARASSGPVQASALPPPSQMLPPAQTNNTRAPVNPRTNRPRETQTPLAQRAAPIQTQAANDPVPTPQAPPAAAAAPGTSTRGAPVANARTAAPSTQIAQAAPASREVAALPVEQQALARPTLTQTAPRASTLWIQAGAFGNYENAYRLSVRLSRYGSTKVIPASVNGSQLFRVRLGPIGDVAEADRVLATLGGEVPEARIVVD